MRARYSGDNVNRRGFLKGICAAAAAAGTPAKIWGVAKSLGRPDLCIGVLSDIHLQYDAKDFLSNPMSRMQAIFIKALEYFRDRHVDAVLVAGDLANSGLLPELELVADAWKKVLPGNKLPDGSPVVNLMYYGDHDVEKRFYNEKRFASMYMKRDGKLPPSLAFDGNDKKYWEELFGEEWSQVMVREVKGYKFILANFDQANPDATVGLDGYMAKYGADLSKPVFYSQHRWMKGTYCTDDGMWGAKYGSEQKAVLDHYPNCVAFTGHTHYMLTDDRTVWQGGFTCINTGALLNQAPGRLRENGSLISWIPSDGSADRQMPGVDIRQCHAGIVFNLYGTDVVLERRDMVRGEPLGPDLCFSIAAEDVKKGLFNDAVRRAKAVAPEFDAEARVTVGERCGKTRRGRECGQYVISFPTVKSKGRHPRAYEYRVSALDAGGTKLAEAKVYSPFINCAESHEPATSICVMEKTALLAARCVRFTVEPLDCWGNAGRAIAGTQI